jgi:hypothetical protein
MVCISGCFEARLRVLVGGDAGTTACAGNTINGTQRAPDAGSVHATGNTVVIRQR